MDMIIVTVRTVDEAVAKALIGLETTNGKPEYEVVDKGSTGLLSIGAGPAIIRARKKGFTEDKAMDFLSQIFGTVDMQVDITAVYNREKQELSLNLEGEDTGIPIGKRGQTPDSLQYPMSLIVDKGMEGHLRVKLDTESYRERRKKTLEILVRNTVYKVKRTKKPVSLEPMSPYERRAAHTALQNDKYVTTRSERGELFRHVAIALRKEAASGDRKGRYDRNEGRCYERSDRSGGYRNSRHTNGNNASRISSNASAETAAGEEE